MIIGFCGPIGAGKTLAAHRLIQHHGFARVRFADPLKSMLRALGLSAMQTDGVDKETPCDLLGGRTPRHAMQTLGTEWGRQCIGPDLWVRAWARVVEQSRGVDIVADDVRFENEAVAIRARGGVIVRVVRPGAWPGPSAHASEKGGFRADLTLKNDGDVAALATAVDALVRDIGWARAG